MAPHAQPAAGTLRAVGTRQCWPSRPTLRTFPRVSQTPRGRRKAAEPPHPVQERPVPSAAGSGRRSLHTPGRAGPGGLGGGGGGTWPGEGTAGLGGEGADWRQDAEGQGRPPLSSGEGPGRLGRGRFPQFLGRWFTSGLASNSSWFREKKAALTMCTSVFAPTGNGGLNLTTTFLR